VSAKTDVTGTAHFRILGGTNIGEGVNGAPGAPAGCASVVATTTGAASPIGCGGISVVLCSLSVGTPDLAGFNGCANVADTGAFTFIRFGGAPAFRNRADFNFDGTMGVADSGTFTTYRFEAALPHTQGAVCP
jgi:hypothetical protein